MEGLAAQGLSHADLEAQEDAEEDADDQGVKSKSKKKKKKGKTEPEATAAADVLTNGERTPSLGFSWSASAHCRKLPSSFLCCNQGFHKSVGVLLYGPVPAQQFGQWRRMILS